MTDSTNVTDPLTVLLHAAKATVAADVIETCRNLLDDRALTANLRQLVREVHYDARVALAEAYEALVDLGAKPLRTVAAVLGVDLLDLSADDDARLRAAFLDGPPDVI